MAVLCDVLISVVIFKLLHTLQTFARCGWLPASYHEDLPCLHKCLEPRLRLSLYCKIKGILTRCLSTSIALIIAAYEQRQFKLVVLWSQSTAHLEPNWCFAELKVATEILLTESDAR